MSNTKLIEKFRKDCLLKGMTNETIRSYISEVKIFSQFLDGGNLLDINRDILREFIEYLKNERKNSISRMKNYFSALSSFYDYQIYERLIDMNPVLEVRRRYLGIYKKISSPEQRKLITIKEMSILINSILDIRGKAIAILLAKTGIRRGELVRIDIDDINWDNMSITLKPTAKRSNKVVFFDNECGIILKQWLKRRKGLAKQGDKALFVGNGRRRLKRSGVYNSIVYHAKKIGLHNPDSNKLIDHFSPHCFRHWFTTMLLRANMPREYVKELRGDARNEAIDIYHHIDREELRKSYLGCIPQLGIM